MSHFKSSLTVVNFLLLMLLLALPGCHSPQQLVKRAQLQGEAAPLMCASDVDAD